MKTVDKIFLPCIRDWKHDSETFPEKFVGFKKKQKSWIKENVLLKTYKLLIMFRLYLKFSLYHQSIINNL